MKSYAIAVFFVFNWDLYGQNLIPNPGFDIISQCPFDYGQINFAFPWATANNGTPDLYNECSNINGINVPHGGHYIDSYQKQRSGQGYSGIFVYTNANFVAYEYIESPLLQELVAGKSYYIEFYVSPDLTLNTYWHYTDGVGLAFNNSFYYIDLAPHKAIPLTPAIENQGNLIIDTIGWTRISGCYIAHGGEKFAIIGNFLKDSDTQIIVEDPNIFPYLNYFYIEDVFVSLFDPLPDTIILCDNEDTKLNARFLDAKYQWNTGESDSVIIIKTPGQYSVEAIMPNCILRDTVVVIQNNIFAYFPSDTTICTNETITLTAPILGSYIWSNGSNEKSIVVDEGGNYFLTITNTCGDYSYEVRVDNELCDCKIFVPNIISSNNDGINDFLSVNFNCDYEYSVQKFEIFDRWGGIIYSTLNNEEIRWDGAISNGKKVQNGVYIWLLNYSIVRNGNIEHFVKTGDITVI